MTPGQPRSALAEQIESPHAPDEQVEDHPISAIARRDDDEAVDTLAEVGEQERREQVHEVADAPHDEQRRPAPWGTSPDL